MFTQVSQVAMMAAECPNLAIYLEEVRYFLQDVLGGSWQDLLRLGASDAEDLILDRVESHVDKCTDEAIRSMCFFVSRGKCPLLLVIEHPTQLQCQVIRRVERLRFLCKGTATVFPYPELTSGLRKKLVSAKLKVPDMLEILSPYYDFILSREPQWALDVQGRSFIARCAIVVMLFLGEQSDFVWHVWDSENEGGQWAFPGGDVCRVHDQSLLGTAEREWNEEVLGPGFAFNVVRSPDFEPIIIPFLEGKSARYPVQPYVVARATTEFFQATQAQRYRFQVPPHAISKSGCKEEDFRRLHTDPKATLVEHDWGTLGFC